jgi:hypothetical protein
MFPSTFGKIFLTHKNKIAMTNQEIATRLYELCQQAQYETAHNELYAPDATSTESNMQGGRETATGMEAIKAKGEQFQSMVEEMFGGYTNEPKVFGKYIFMEMGMDVKMKGMDRMNMVEMCRYEIKDGKIIAEEFYY